MSERRTTNAAIILRRLKNKYIVKKTQCWVLWLTMAVLGISTTNMVNVEQCVAYVELKIHRTSTLIISYKGLIISVYVQVRLRNVMLFSKMYSVLKYVTCYMHDLSTSTITLEKFILIHTLELIATWLVCTALFKTSEGL